MGLSAATGPTGWLGLAAGDAEYEMDVAWRAESGPTVHRITADGVHSGVQQLRGFAQEQGVTAAEYSLPLASVSLKQRQVGGVATLFALTASNQR